MRHLIELSRYLSIKRKSDDIQNSQQKIQNIVKITLEGGGTATYQFVKNIFVKI